MSDDTKTTTPTTDPDLVAMIKRQVMEELSSEEEKQRQQQIVAREDAKQAQQNYVDRMKNSKDPWVDIQGWVDTPEGVRVELDWNDAFVDFLKKQGISGADEDQMVQRWVTLLLRDMTHRLEDDGTSSEFT